MESCKMQLFYCLEEICCHLLLEHLCDVYKISRHENSNLSKSSVVFLSFTTYIAACIVYGLSHFELIKKGDISFNERMMCLLCSCLVAYAAQLNKK